MTIPEQIFWLFILPLPIVCVTRTVIFEEIFKPLQEYARQQCQPHRPFYCRKFFYIFTCEYCFSHYVTLFFLILARFHLLLPDWRGYLIAFFALVFITNLYLNFYSHLRLDIHREKVEIQDVEQKIGK